MYHFSFSRSFFLSFHTLQYISVLPTVLFLPISPPTSAGIPSVGHFLPLSPSLSASWTLSVSFPLPLTLSLPTSFNPSRSSPISEADESE